VATGLLGATYMVRSEAYPKAKQAALKALQLDNTLAEAQYALASAHLFYDWDWASAKREAQLAIRLNPNSPDAHILYAYYLLIMGSVRKCITEIKLAQELEPLSRLINTFWAWALYFGRHYDQAIEQCLNTLELDADFPPLRALIGRAYLMKGMYREALA